MPPTRPAEPDRRRAQAAALLYDHGLAGLLERYGAVHVVGSYRMDLMAWNDLDLYVDNARVRLEDLHAILMELLPTYRPTWLEAKEEVTGGKRRLFLGFETMLLGELWNVDIWFYDVEDIREGGAYCDRITAAVAADGRLRDAILDIKRDLIERGDYGHAFHSVDVYSAVIDHGIRSTADFLRLHGKGGA